MCGLDLWTITILNMFSAGSVAASDRLIADYLALVLLCQTRADEVYRLIKRNLDLLAGLHVLDGYHAGIDFVLAEEDDERDAELVGIADLVLELLLLAVELHPQTGGADVLRQIFYQVVHGIQIVIHRIHQGEGGDVAGLKQGLALGVHNGFIGILSEDQEGLGKAGDVLGLEVNMRPAGGYTPDMYNYSQETDVYKIWADMVCFDCNTKPTGKHHFCAFYGRRDGTHYKLDDYEIMMKYAGHIVMNGRIPDALSGAMANQMYVGNFDTEEEMKEFYRDLSDRL